MATVAMNMANASYVYEIARSDSRAAEEFASQMNHGRGINYNLCIL
jgi:hypothetical protein